MNLKLDIDRDETDELEPDVALELRDLDRVDVRKSHLTQKLKRDQMLDLKQNKLKIQKPSEYHTSPVFRW